MAVPKKDSLLVPFSKNFKTRITESPARFALTPEQASAYAALHGPYITAYDDMVEARSKGTWSQPLTAIKDAAKAKLLPYARELYTFVQANASVSDADKILLGVHVRDNKPTPVPPPTESPIIEASLIQARRVQVTLKGSGPRNARPSGVAGTAVFSHLGPEPPADVNGWQFATMTGKMTVTLNLDGAAADADTLWITAFFFNPRKESGPAAQPISLNLPAAKAVPAGAKLKIAA